MTGIYDARFGVWTAKNARLVMNGDVEVWPIIPMVQSFTMISVAGYEVYLFAGDPANVLVYRAFSRENWKPVKGKPECGEVELGPLFDYLAENHPEGKIFEELMTRAE